MSSFFSLFGSLYLVGFLFFVPFCFCSFFLFFTFCDEPSYQRSRVVYTHTHTLSLSLLHTHKHAQQHPFNHVHVTLSLTHPPHNIIIPFIYRKSYIISTKKKSQFAYYIALCGFTTSSWERASIHRMIHYCLDIGWMLSICLALGQIWMLYMPYPVKCYDHHYGLHSLRSMSKSKQVAMYQQHPNAEVRLKETCQLCMEI